MDNCPHDRVPEVVANVPPTDSERRSGRTPTQLWATGLGRAAVRSAQVLLILALVTVAVWAAVQLRLVVVPLLLAVLIAAAASPLVSWLSRRGLPRGLAAWVVLVGSLAVLGGLAWLVGRAARDQWDELRQGAAEGVSQLRDYLAQGPLQIDDAQLERAWEQASEVLAGPAVQAGALSGAVLLAEIVAGLFLGIVVLFFLLKDGSLISTFVRDFLPSRHTDRYDRAALRSVDVLGGYVRGTAVIALVDAVLIGAALAVLGVPLALPLAVVVFVAAFIPLVGATLAGFLAAVVALVSSGPVTALIVVVVVVVVNQVEGDVLAPVVLGASIKLHPLAILLALSGGTIVAGMVGAILAVPFTGVAWAVLQAWREGPSEQPDAPAGKSAGDKVMDGGL